MEDGQGTIERRQVNPWTWQDRFGYSQAVEVTGARRVLVCAGQASVDADGSPLHEGDMAAQLSQTLDNLETVLSEAGMSLSDVIRVNTYTTDVDTCLATYGTVAERLAGAGCQPASTLVGVTRLAFPALMVEIEATAVAG